MKKFQVLVIDPPWPKKKGGLRKVRPSQNRELDYPTMGVAEIFELLDNQIFPQADSPHCVFLWTIDEFLHAADEEMFARDYRRHARIIWNKCNGVAPAFTVRYSHEYLNWYYKPKFLPIAEECRGRFTTVWKEAGRQHSRKPDISYKRIMRLYPQAQRLDVFSRERRVGWSQWGNQLSHFSGEAEVT